MRHKNKQKNEKMDGWVTRCVRIMNGERRPYCYEYSPYCYGCSVVTLMWEQGVRGRGGPFGSTSFMEAVVSIFMFDCLVSNLVSFCL